MHEYFLQEGFAELYALAYIPLSTRIHTMIANQEKSQMRVKKKEKVSKKIPQRLTSQLKK